MRIINVGVNDHKIDLFEGQFKVPLGMRYNSYVIDAGKTVVMDTVDVNFKEEWLNNIKALNIKIDYLVIQHMEPDHSASLDYFLEAYPDTIVVGNQKTFIMINQFFPNLTITNQLVVKEGDVIDLGETTLKFIMAPMVHWPEVMMTYETNTKSFFSADAFGKFGANDIEDPEGWACEARRYYFGIVGKYGLPVQNLFKKISSVDVDNIYPLHGPELHDNLSYYLNLYNIWSSYTPEKNAVTICYSSVYGNTKKAAMLLAEKLYISGMEVDTFDLARDDFHEAIEGAFENSKLVLASITYNGDIFPDMKKFIEALKERAYQNRTVGFIENGSWAPQANKIMIEEFSNMKNITILENNITIKSSLNNDTINQIDELADSLLK